jgi:hypothetical protein
MNDLLRLPNELILEIIPHLDPLSKHHLSLTNQALHCLVGPVKLDQQTTWTLRLELEKADPHRYRRVCSCCLRFRPFWHYSLAQAGAKTKPYNRRCLECVERGREGLYQKQVVNWFFGITIRRCCSCGRFVRYDILAQDIPTHYCSFGPALKLEDLPTIEGEEPLVCHLRARLDRVETILPPKYLLSFRPHRSPNYDFHNSKLSFLLWNPGHGTDAG